jgi:hypothetical protein
MAFGHGFGSKQNTVLRSCCCWQDLFSLRNCFGPLFLATVGVLLALTRIAEKAK